MTRHSRAGYQKHNAAGKESITEEEYILFICIFFQKLAKVNGILYWNAYEGGNTVKENKRMRC